MKMTEFESFIEKAFKRRKTVMVVGPPGVGKTFIKMQVARRLGMAYIGLCSALEDPSTIRGYPSRGADGRASHCLFDGIARAFDAKDPTVLDFDDLGMASESTMRAIMRLFQFGEIDNRKLPDCVVLSASTNDINQGSGVIGMLEPLKSRFHTIVNVETSVEDIAPYALAHNWPMDLIAFLRNSPDALHDWKPEKSMKVGGACPRGWEYAAEWVNDGVTDPEVIAGCVGKGRATQYLAFRELINDLPDIDALLLDPEAAPVPDNPSARFLVSCAVASRMKAGNFGACVKYLGKLPAMFRAFSIRDAFRAEGARKKDKTLPKDYVPLSSSRDFVSWTVSEDGKNVMSAAS